MQGSDYSFVSRAPTKESGANQSWDILHSGQLVARADVYCGESQWGVSLLDKLPALDVSELLQLVAHLLLWESGCRADTVDVVLARTGQHYPLIRAGSEYV